MSEAATANDSPEQGIARLHSRLRSDRVVYLPIRHHSPACAWHVRRTILDLEPSAVLIEGPADLTPLIELILHPEARPPFAVYTTYVDRGGPIVPRTEDARRHEPPRFAAYYPFCDYSPELVALRTGREVGAELRFIDLTYPQQVLAEIPRAVLLAKPRNESLLEERLLGESRYLQALAKRAGCRDVNDLWDHLFEIRHAEMTSEEFFRRVAAYCLMARRDTPDAVLEQDGTTARECAMAVEIRAQLARSKSRRKKGPVVVVTGGFHTAVLPDLVDAREAPEKPEPLSLSREDAQTVLMRYSFDRLDALNGYAAGMPAPHYYEQVWGLICDQHPDPYLETAARVIVRIGRLTRERELPFALSTADEMAALEQARRLARLRGHPGPTREDLLDGIRSSFVKGALDAEGTVVMGIVAHVLAGTAIGEIPSEAGVPPLVEDFRRRAAALGLSVGDTVRKKLALDIYRSSPHRRISRLLHSLEFLGAPFGAMLAGPDFVCGRGLDLMQEHWEYGWSPLTESSLIEASIYGATVEEAAAGRLRHAVAELEEAGRSRSTSAAVSMLVRACRMGLHGHVDRVLDLIDRNIAEDPAFASLAGGLAELGLLWQSREPLEAHGLAQVPTLARTAYRRACFLVRELAACPDDQSAAALEGLAAVRLTLAASQAELFDRSLFLDALADVSIASSAPAVIAGGAAGILFGEGQLEEDELVRRAAGYLMASTPSAPARTGFLQGLLFTCREAVWRVPALLERIDRLLHDWDEDDFVGALPELRLAFSHLTPRETDRVAGLVAGLHGRKDLGNLVHHRVSQAEMAINVRLSHAVTEWLKKEHLGGWIERPIEPGRPAESTTDVVAT